MATPSVPPGGGQQPGRSFPRLLKTRIALLFVGAMFLFVLTVGRLAYLQLWQHDRYAGLALGQRFRGEVIEPERGRIYDRNFHPLAMSIYSDAVYARPDRVGDADETARRLAELIGGSYEDVYRRLNIQAPAVTVSIRLDPEQATAVREANLPGVYLQSRPQRYYPHGRLAGNVLGFAGADNQGLEGLEHYYDELLRGTPGRRLSERDARGRSIPDGRDELIPPVPGHSLVLTIDHTLQYLVEQRLREAVAATQATWGAVVAVQPRTGEILAMAQEPSADPFAFGGTTGPFRNRIVSDQIEPGSTLKAVVMAIALELGVVTPHDLMEGPPELYIGGGRVRCWRYPLSFGLQTMEEALANSCNTVFARLGGEKLPRADFAAYLRAFGFGSPLGIDFPGEASGHVPTPGRVHGEVLRWANVAFGQGISVTPLQLAMAFSALVNDGFLMRPYLVKEIRDAGGRTVSLREPEVIRQVVSSRTARQTVRALEKTVAEGTGSLARIEGYRVLGKTGTAQIPVPGGYGEGRIASFIGAAPAEAPEVVTLVVLYDVKSAVRYGGQLAAPLFADITETILEQRGVPRTHLLRAAGVSSPSGRSAAGGQRPDVRPPAEPVPVPVSLGQPDATPTNAPAPAPPAVDPFPAWATGSDWWFAGAADPFLENEDRPVAVPDIRGRTIRAAIDVLESAGLRIRVFGSGVATRQVPAPGERVPPHTPVEAYFELPPGIRR